MSLVSNIRVLGYKVHSHFIRWKLTKVYGMDIGRNVRVSRRAVLDYSRNPKGIHIGDNSMITGNVIMLAHDHVRGIVTDTFIGSHVFLGGEYYYARSKSR